MVNKITTPPTTSELINKVNEIIDDKQDIISDLSTIRSGAALGATALQSNDNISELTNDSGYITNSALAPYVLSSSLASVATSGSYNDLSNKPTIPTVNNPTITFTQGGTTKGTITLNQSSNQTIAFDAGGGSQTWSYDSTTETLTIS